MSDLKIAPGFVLPLDVVTEAIGIVATRGAGKSFTSAVVLEEAYAAGVPFVVIDPNGVYWGLRSNAKGDGPGLPVYVLGGPRGDLPLEPTAGKLIADLVVDSGHSFVLDLSDLLTKKAARQFVADFLDHLHRRKARDRTTLLLVVDEADEFAPQKPRDDTIRSLGAMETIAKRGRAWGLGIVMITQRTQALNKDVLDLIETLVVMRQLSPRSRDAVAGWIADKDLRDESGVMPSLQSLPTGTAWVWSPLRSILERVAVRRIRTFDSYATPKPGETRVEPSSRSELDLDALGEQMRATVERQKENDPTELKRRIRELEREKRDMVVEREVPEVVERAVEVPVLSKDDLALLDALVSRVEEGQERSRLAYEDLRGVLYPLASNVKDALTQRDRPTPAAKALIARPSTSEVRAIARVKVPQPEANGDVKIGKGERKVLQALAEFPDGRTHNELAFLTGYSAGASTIGTFISKLRAAGLVEQGQPFRATANGLAAAGGVVERPTGPALLDEWLRHPKMELGMRLVLNVLVDRYPIEPTHEELCEATGYSPTASTVGTFLSKLRKLGLVEGGRKLSPAFAEAIR